MTTQTTKHGPECFENPETCPDMKPQTTKRYRVRRGLFGKCILQQQFDTPSLLGGHVDSTIRDIHWSDVDFPYAPAELKDVRY